MRLTYGDECFIAKKHNNIRKNSIKLNEIEKRINDLIDEKNFITDEIEADRYSIRKKIGRVKHE